MKLATTILILSSAVYWPCVSCQISSDQFSYHCGKTLRVAFNIQAPYTFVDTTKVRFWNQNIEVLEIPFH